MFQQLIADLSYRLVAVCNCAWAFVEVQRHTLDIVCRGCPVDLLASVAASRQQSHPKLPLRRRSTDRDRIHLAKVHWSLNPHDGAPSCCTMRAQPTLDSHHSPLALYQTSSCCFWLPAEMSAAPPALVQDISGDWTGPRSTWWRSELGALEEKVQRCKNLLLSSSGCLHPWTSWVYS